ncbi:MAG: class I SAM-dependent methyltransferase [Planctomycetales bacterium]|nr:class I SAM-dependent methyltransferase [Planctomycetales bacterium]
MAEFKAEWLNDFVQTHGIKTVVEFGSGDGAQLTLANYPSYLGLDISPMAIDQCKTRFSSDDSKQFRHYQPDQFEADGIPLAELSISLDVIYHLVEDAVFETYMKQLFSSAEKFVVIYASNHDEHTAVAHVRHRRFTDWINSHLPAWRLIQHIPNRYPFDPNDWENTSFADFYVFGRHA